VHGEENVEISFGELIKDKFSFTTHIPAKGEVFEL